jgi:hypothetical protein
MSITCDITAAWSPYLSSTCTGLGNTLFQIATTYALGKKSGKLVSFPKLNYLLNKLDSYGLRHRHTIYRAVPIFTVPFGAKISGPVVSRSYSAPFEKQVIGTPGSVYLEGYLQSYHFFKDYKEDLLEMFGPPQEDIDHIYAKYPQLIDQNTATISVHYRFFGANADNNASFDYIQKAMNYVGNRVSNPLFFVFSDALERCKSEVQNRNVVFVEGNPDYIDMWMMSLCQHNILCQWSSFCWWGAYMNRSSSKFVVYPQKYPDALDTFPEGWTCFREV